MCILRYVKNTINRVGVLEYELDEMRNTLAKPGNVNKIIVDNTFKTLQVRQRNQGLIYTINEGIKEDR